MADPAQAPPQDAPQDAPQVRVGEHTQQVPSLLVNGPDFTLYALVVTYRGETWTVLRRYNDFLALQRNLDSVQAVTPPLPPKRYFGSSLEPAFVRGRRLALQRYLDELVRTPFHPLRGRLVRSNSIDSGARSSFRLDTLTTPPDSPTSLSRNVSMVSINQAGLAAPAPRPPAAGATLEHFSVPRPNVRPLWSENRPIQLFLELDRAAAQAAARPQGSDATVWSSEFVPDCTTQVYPSGNWYSEDLHNSNPFLADLRTHCADLHEEARQEGHLVCIPQQKCAQLRENDRASLERHILRSANAIGEYRSLDGRLVRVESSRVAVFESDEMRVIMSEGAEPAAPILTADVLFEELIYGDSDSKPLRVCCVARRLDMPLDTQDELLAASGQDGSDAGTDEEAPETPVFPNNKAFDTYVAFFEGVAGLENALARVRHFTWTFNWLQPRHVAVDVQSQVVIVHSAGLLPPVQRMCAFLLRDVYESGALPQCFQNQRDNVELKQAVASYVIGLVYPSLFAAFAAIHGRDDDELMDTMIALKSIVPSQIGVRPEFQVSTAEAVAELDLLNDYATPLEKLLCIRHAANLISREVDKNVRQVKGTRGARSSLAITTDDLLSLLVYAIIKARPRNLLANLEFIDTYHFQLGHASMWNQELSFYFANFQAAVRYLQTDQGRTLSTPDTPSTATPLVGSRTPRVLSPQNEAPPTPTFRAPTSTLRVPRKGRSISMVPYFY